MKCYTKNQNYRRNARLGHAPRFLPGWPVGFMLMRLGPARFAAPAVLAMAALLGGNL